MIIRLAGRGCRRILHPRALEWRMGLAKLLWHPTAPAFEQVRVGAFVPLGIAVVGAIRVSFGTL